MDGRHAQLLLATLLGVLSAAAPAAASKPNPHAALDCNYCHSSTPRFGVDTRETVDFYLAEGDEPHLCEGCHGPEANIHPLGIGPDPARLGTHVPVHLPLGKSEAVRGQVVCISCHFVHAANADHALLRGFPGADQPGLFTNWQELCRECHGADLEKRSPHAGDQRSCAFCHSTQPQAGKPAAVTPAGRKLCEFCHGNKPEEHYAGITPFKESQECTACHDPHLGKDNPARLRAGYFESIRNEVTINPHRKRTLCFACHSGGKPAPLQAAAVGAVCQRCHGSGKIAGMSHPLTKVPAGYPIPQGWPLVDGALTCVTCHVPGHAAGAIAGDPEGTATAPYLLRGAVDNTRNALCFRCHPKNQWTGRDPHREAAVKQTGCTQCHAENPEEGDTDKFVADINIVCLSCHDNPEHPGGVRHTVTLRQGMPEVPASLPLGTGRRITCATCHDPHLESPAGHRLRGGKEPPAFCLRCHKL